MSSKISRKTTETATAIHKTYTTRLEQIRKDNSLSPVGKRDAVARLWKATQAEMDTLASGKKEALASEQAKLKAAYWGLTGSDRFDPNRVAIQRDSLDRASTIKDENDAVEAFKNAHERGDMDMTRAIAHVAYDQGWGGVLDGWIHYHPESKNSIVEAWDIRTDLARTDRGVVDNQSLADEMITSLAQPLEVKDMSPLDLRSAVEASTV